ncbi:hypothetical protein SAMN05216553_11962 [Lentzea fradiae]|uniref:Phenylacetate-coenzyme A ligase PaaK, adenylate-forming domain family n=1 Tax=Lentzea fradiae TaxID=200378 RepID=A0A1G8BGP7_9PSEU|nr:hypothetical protein SAMN05216553_11962 [Lentzea fradiae]
MTTRSGGFRDRQLGPTLSHAARHPFYRDHWAPHLGAPSARDPWALLDALPPTERRHLSEDVTPMLDDGDEIVAVGFSSGSTGSAMTRYFTARERELAGMFTKAGPARTGAVRPLRLDFPSTWHGVGGADTPGAVLIPGTVVDDEHAERTVHMLRRRFTAPGVASRVSMLSGGVIGIHAFTRYVVDHEIPVSDFAIEVVGLFGGYPGRRRLAWLGEYWKCPVLDSFSVSECRGKALVCPNCGYLEFDPQLVAQALALDSPEPVTSGTARLAVTELYPFGIAQPIVKYLTGDLVEVLDDTSACRPGHVGGLRRIGRAETSVTASANGTTTVLVPSQVLFDAFDRPGVCRADFRSTLSGMTVNDLAQPYVHASLSETEGTLRLRCRYRPDGSGIDCTADALAALLSWPVARAWADSGRLVIDLVADPATAPPRSKFA